MFRILYLQPDGSERRTDPMPERAAELLARDLLESGQATAARLEAKGETVLLRRQEGGHYLRAGEADSSRQATAAARRGMMLRALIRGERLEC